MGLVCQEASTLTQGPHFNLIFNLFSIKDTAWGGQHQKTAAEPGDEADAPGERGYRQTHGQITEQL